jgi:uncharacterized protein YuzE
MEKFNFDYDLESDDLFVYLEGKKSKGAIELGNFILDFDKRGDLVAIQILNISDVLNKFFSKIKDISKVKEIKTDRINLRNMEGIKFSISDEFNEESANFLIPHIREKSPVLRY